MWLLAGKVWFDVEVIIVLLGAAILVGGGFLIALFWAVKNGQYDDLFTPSVRMLHETPGKSNENIIDKSSEIN